MLRKQGTLSIWVLLFFSTPAIKAIELPWPGEQPFRVIFSVRHPETAWKTAPMQVDLHFKDIQRWTGLAPEQLNLGATRIMAFDGYGEPVRQNPNAGELEQYEIPFRLQEIDDLEMLTFSWRIPLKNVAFITITFSAIGTGPGPMQQLPVVGNGDMLTHGIRGVTGPISGGYNESIAVGDLDGDQDLDLLIAFSGTTDQQGIYYFENIGTLHSPVLTAGYRIYPEKEPVQLVEWDGDRLGIIDKSLYKFSRDGKLRIGKEIITGLVDAAGVYLDWDEDGRRDWITTNRLERSYYPSTSVWHRSLSPYNELGVWMGENDRSAIVWCRNTGSNRQPLFAESQPVFVNNSPIELYGQVALAAGDLDGDGDSDLVAGNSMQLFWFENLGNQYQPKLDCGKLVLTRPGQAPFSIYVRPVCADWDGDGDTDILLGNEDGRPTWIENCGTGNFGDERFLSQQDPELDVGCLSVPVLRDWDNDSDLDLVSGNSSGFIEFFENISSAPDRFIFAPATRLQAGGQDLRILALQGGSIQGPDEAKYGYTMPEIADWDDDGDFDLLLSDIKGEHHWFENVGVPTKPVLASPRLLKVNWQSPPPKPAWIWWQPGANELITQWRCRPAVADWNQDGICDYITVDHEGYLAWYQGFWRDNEKWLQPGRRILDESQRAIQLTSLPGGQSGRARVVVVDWDGDGDLDVIHNAHGLFGAAMCLLKKVNNAGWFENVGSGATPVLLWQGELIKPALPRLSEHSSAPEPIDLDDDGTHDLILGGEDGRFYCCHRAFIENDLPGLRLIRFDRR